MPMMNQIRAICLVLLCLLFVNLHPVFTFESEQDKRKALRIISIVRDPGVRLDLQRNIELGNIDSMGDLNDAIERYWEEYQFPDLTVVKAARDMSMVSKDKVSAPKVYASGGHYLDKIRVIWNLVPGTTHYKVFRSSKSNGQKVELTGWLTSMGYPPADLIDDPNRIGPTPKMVPGLAYYDDHDVTAGWDNWYYYWVKAASDSNGSNESLFSEGYGYDSYKGFRAPWDPWNPPDNEQTIAKAEKFFDTGERRFDYENFRGAIDSYTKAIEIYPGYARAYYKRGLSRYNLFLEGYNSFGGKFGRIRDYKKAAKLGETDAQEWLKENNIGW